MTKSINKMIMAFLVVILVLLSVVLMPRTALANEDDYEYDDYGYIFYVNEQTGYQAYVIDYMDLLKESEEISLLEEMKSITDYGNAVFFSNNENAYESAAKGLYTDLYDEESGTIFSISMAARKITLWSYGNVLDTISINRAQVIVSNTYSYASDENYYKCAKEAFNQENILLRGGKISQKMKHTSNFFLALVLSTGFCYIFILIKSMRHKLSVSEIAENIDYQYDEGGGGGASHGF